MTTETTKDLDYWRKNAEEDYITTPISVLRYINELEQQVNSVDLADVVVPKGKLCDHFFKHLKFVRDRQIVCKCGERFSY
jgi:hypothetical protein